MMNTFQEGIKYRQYESLDVNRLWLGPLKWAGIVISPDLPQGTYQDTYDV